MRRSYFVLVALILVITPAVELTKDGLNMLTKENMDFVLDQNNTVLAIWNSANCMDCGNDMWNVYHTIYSFLDEPTFFVLATSIGMDEELDKEYGIDPNEGGSLYRLFVKGSHTPVCKEELDESGTMTLNTWIAHVTHFVPQPDCVTGLTTETYDAFFKKNPKRSAMIMYYIPSFKSSQMTVVQFYRAALAFQIEASVVFAKLDCSSSSDLCKAKGVANIPSFLFYPGDGVEFDGKQIETNRGEGIVLYLKLGYKEDTNVSPRGGFDEQYERHRELDRLAHLFMVNKNEDQRKRFMKETAKLRKRYRSTAKYYKVMKEVRIRGFVEVKIMKEGSAAIMKELRAVKDGLKNAEFTDDTYPSLKARENIVHQFEAIQTKRELVHLNPWNFDYVVNGIDTVVVIFHTPWCDICADLVKEMGEVVKYRTDDVVFATMDAQLYVDFCAPFHLDHFPAIKLFKAGKSVREPVEIPGASRGDIEKYLREHEEEEL